MKHGKCFLLCPKHGGQSLEKCVQGTPGEHPRLLFPPEPGDRLQAKLEGGEAGEWLPGCTRISQGGAGVINPVGICFNTTTLPLPSRKKQPDSQDADKNFFMLFQ